MAVPQLDQLLSLVPTVSDIWQTAFSKLGKLTGPNGETFDFSKPIPGMPRPCSITELTAKLEGTLSLTKGLGSLPDLILFPDLLWTDVDTSVRNLKTHVESLNAILDSEFASTQIASLDVVNFIVAVPNKQVGLAGPLASVYTAVQQLLSHARTAVASMGLHGTANVENQLAGLSQAQATQQTHAVELERARGKAEATLNEISTLAEKSRTLKDEIDKEKSAATTAREETQTIAKDAGNTAPTINAILTESKNLQTSVQNYQNKFNEFSSQLTNRNNQFSADQTLLDELKTRLAKTEDQLNRLVNRSREVLGEATVAGLSDRFAKEDKSLQKRLRTAQLLLFSGVLLLVLTAGAILDLFPWARDWIHYTPLTTPTAGDPWLVVHNILTGIVGKLILLTPSVVLIAFAAKWYAALFHLQTQYAYKYTVAASLAGFKTEAPTYAEAITATAFKELLFNPGDAVKADEKAEDKTWRHLLEPHIKKMVDEMVKSLKSK